MWLIIFINLLDLFIPSIMIVYNTFTFIGMSDGFVFEKVREYSWSRGIFVMTDQIVGGWRGRGLWATPYFIKIH